MLYDCRLTTFDNPFDPFEQFTSWLLFDKEKGYNTCEYLARTLQRLNLDADDMSEKEESEAQEFAIDEIIKHDFMNIYKKVRRKQSHT